MSRMLSETLVSLRDACGLIPGRHKLGLPAIQRWRRQGVRGVRLETVLVAGRRFTSREAIDRFLQKVNTAAASDPAFSDESNSDFAERPAVSDMVHVINRLEAWVRNYGHQKQPEFIADLRALLNTAKASQRAAELLQNAQRYSLDPHGDFYQGESMQSNDIGDWVEFDDVVKAIQILEGQQ